MKNIKIFLKILVVAILVLTSCEDMLELQPKDAFSDADVWADPVLAETFINGIYNKLHQPLNKFSVGNFVDELHRRDGGDEVNFNNCLMTPDKISSHWRSSSGNYYLKWDNLYKNVRACNKYFANVDIIPDDPALIDGVTMKDRMTGEVTFLRAYMYYCLTSLHGAVPLVTEAYGLDDDFNAPRNTYAECIQFIVDECDKAAGLLPLVQTGTNKGRVTKGAALTLKSRILLYAASDLHNTTVFPSYANQELLGYVSGSQTDRYQAAKDAAKAVMDLDIYSLYKANPSPTDSVTVNIEELFMSQDTEEDIWIRYYAPTSFYDVNGTFMNLSGPNGYHCRGSNAIIDNLVRDYERKDGTKFDWNNPVHAAAPYKYRDPRFYATVLYEGAKWRTRGAGEIALDPLGVLQVGVWMRWDAATSAVIEHWGLDTRKGPNSPFEGNYTGYYIRKYMDITVDAQFDVDDTPWRYMRYAEVLLNYAEACIGLGQDAEARTYINMIRKRAGMPDVTESGTALRDRYRNERRIEMAIEDQRFFDVRRWVIGPEAYVASYKVLVVYPLLPDNTTATVPIITPAVHNTYNWLDHAYFLPILRDEMNKNSALIQNPGYE